VHPQLALRLAMPHQRRPGVFYQTTPLSPDERAQALARAAFQDERVLAVYRTADAPLTPSQVHRILDESGYRCPIVSVRRAINTLTKERALVKLVTTRPGPWGSKEHEWALPAGVAAA
jgi:hypothetical protein